MNTDRIKRIERRIARLSATATELKVIADGATSDRTRDAIMIGFHNITRQAERKQFLLDTLRQQAL